MAQVSTTFTHSVNSATMEKSDDITIEVSKTLLKQSQSKSDKAAYKAWYTKCKHVALSFELLGKVADLDAPQLENLDT